MRHLTRRIPFGAQSRGRRKAAFISVKNDIRRHARILGGLFYTHDYLHGKNGWIDCLFLGRKPPVFYNCVLDTTRNAYKEQVRELVYERSYVLAPDDGPGLLEQAVRDPVSGMWTSTLSEAERLDALGGLSRHEWVEQQIPHIADSAVIKIHEGWTLHHDYRFGIGLHAILDAPYLTIDVVNAFVERFLATEAGYANPNPISYRHVEIENWHIESNAIAGPDAFRRETLKAWQALRADGLHLTIDETDAWMVELEQGNDIEPPQSHT